MQIRVLKHLIVLCTTMIFIAGCDKYTSWGPMCVSPVDPTNVAKSVEVNSTSNAWVNTGITLNKGDRFDIDLVQGNEAVPITLCGRETQHVNPDGTKTDIIASMDAKNEDWTAAPADIPPLKTNDIVYIKVGSPNQKDGIAGNKWTKEGSGSCRYPGSGGMPCGGGTGIGSPPWDDKLGIYATQNNACIYPTSTFQGGLLCWQVYGSDAKYRLAATNNVSRLIGATQYPLVPKAFVSGITADQVKQMAEDNRRLIVIDPVPSNGYLQFRADDCAGCYFNNGGGYEFAISHYGCPRKNGEGLVAYIGKDIPDAGTSPTWSSNFLTLGPDGITYSKRITSVSDDLGTLWLKIDDPDGDYSVNSNQGGYILNIRTSSTTCASPPCEPGAPNDILSNIVEKVVGWIEQILRRAQQNLFEGLAGVSTSKVNMITGEVTTVNRVGSLVGFIRASLVLYIAIYGVAFAFGLIQSPQYDFITRVVKVAIIIQLIGPNAWSFFNTYFFTVFTDGTKYIIYILNNLFDTQGFNGTGQQWVTHMEEEWVKTGASVNFDFIDRTAGQFLEQRFWLKVAGLLFSGPFGWIYLIAIVIGSLIFLRGVIKAILAYIISLIAMAMLIGVSPLFFIFALFSQTKELFESWIQQMVNYALRPILIFTALAVFNFLMWAAIERMMSFGVCWKCVLNIKFDTDILPTICVLYFYQPFTYDNFGNVVNTTSATSFFSVITYLILAVLMEKFIPFMEGLATSITGSTGKASILAPAAGSKPGSAKAGSGSMYDDLKRPFGMDNASVARRAKTKADDKKISGIKRNILETRDKQAGGTGMSKFDETQKAERTAELSTIQQETKKPGSSIKERAAALEASRGTSSPLSRPKTPPKPLPKPPPKPLPKPPVKGMANFEKGQRVARVDELQQLKSDVRRGGSVAERAVALEVKKELGSISAEGMEKFDRERKEERQRELEAGGSNKDILERQAELKSELSQLKDDVVAGGSVKDRATELDKQNQMPSLPPVPGNEPDKSNGPLIGTHRHKAPTDLPPPVPPKAPPLPDKKE